MNTHMFGEMIIMALISFWIGDIFSRRTPAGRNTWLVITAIVMTVVLFILSACMIVFKK